MTHSTHRTYIIALALLLAFFSAAPAAGAAWFHSHDVSAGLVARWTLDEGGGLSAKDTSGNNNTGTLVNTPTWVAGKIGKALSFNGTSQYANAGTGSSLNLTSSLTLSVWINESAVDGLDRAVISKFTGTAANYIIRINNGSVRFMYYSGSWHVYQSSSAPITSGVWHHIVITYTSGSASSARMYVDDALVSASWTGGTGNAGLLASADPLTIGGDSLVNEYFNGAIDDVRIYNRALSAAEVATIYNAAKPSTVASSKTSSSSSLKSGLVGWWTMDGKDMNWATNRVLYSQTLTNAAWTKAGSTISTSAVAAPDGSTLFLLQEDSSTGTHYANVPGPSWTWPGPIPAEYFSNMSIYVKAKERTKFQIFFGFREPVVDAWVTYDLSALTAVGGASNFGVLPTGSITAVGNGVYRVNAFLNLVGTGYAASNGGVKIILLDASGSSSYTGDGSSGMYLWGGQFEWVGNANSNAPTSYIPTTSAAVTGSVIDRSVSTGFGNNGAPVSLTTASNVPGISGQALSFNGSTQSILAGSIASGSSGTMVAWIKPGGDYSSRQDVMWGSDVAGSDTSSRYGIGLRHTGICAGGDWFTIMANGVTTQYVCAGQVFNQTNFPAGVWTQLIITYDGSFVRFYKDGKLINSIVQTVSGAGSAQPFGIGRSGGYNGSLFNGVIDDVRIYNRALSAAEVKALYNTTKPATAASSQTSPSANGGLVGWWTFDGSKTNWNTNTTADSSGQNNTGTLTNMSTTTSPVPGKLGQALKFDGSTSYVSAPDTPSLDFSGFSGGTAPMAISAWVKWTGSTEAYNSIVAKENGGSGYTILLKSNQKIAFYLSGSSSIFQDGLGGTVPFGMWTHVVGVYDGTTMTTYINGVGTVSTPSGNSWGSAANPLLIGRSVFGAGRYFNGTIDDVRIYSRALSASEVKSLYNAGR